MRIDSMIEGLKRRRTKIVATVGPASDKVAMVNGLIQAGVDVFRLNMSHGTHETHRQAYAHIRAASEELGVPVGVFGDLGGPKIRVGTFADGQISLGVGDRVTVTTRDVEGGPGLIRSLYEDLAADVKPEDRILLDDGKLEIRVVSVKKTEIECTVIHGGVLRNRKGINLPGVAVSALSLTPKDKEDAVFALELGVDFLALSFVREASDVEDLRRLMDESPGRSVPIISKIEKAEALENFDAILEASDAIMVARGDLGVELPPEVVPVVQDQLVARARANATPVIVATQMLESMVMSSRPTRAEVSDVSHAVGTGADAVMLSAETAVGENPVAAVQMMDAIARRTEGYLFHESAFGSFSTSIDNSRGEKRHLRDAVARATAQLSRDLLVRSIIVISTSGRTASIISSVRPASPMIVVTTDPSTYRQLKLLWGVVPFVASATDIDHPEELARKVASDLGLATAGQHVLVVRGFKPDPVKDTPVISVVEV